MPSSPGKDHTYLKPLLSLPPQHFSPFLEQDHSYSRSYFSSIVYSIGGTSNQGAQHALCWPELGNVNSVPGMYLLRGIKGQEMYRGDQLQLWISIPTLHQVLTLPRLSFLRPIYSLVTLYPWVAYPLFPFDFIYQIKKNPDLVRRDYSRRLLHGQEGRVERCLLQ